MNRLMNVRLDIIRQRKIDSYSNTISQIKLAFTSLSFFIGLTVTYMRFFHNYFNFIDNDNVVPTCFLLSIASAFIAVIILFMAINSLEIINNMASDASKKIRSCDRKRVSAIAFVFLGYLFNGFGVVYLIPGFVNKINPSVAIAITLFLLFCIAIYIYQTNSKKHNKTK